MFFLRYFSNFLDLHCPCGIYVHTVTARHGVVNTCDDSFISIIKLNGFA